MKKPTLSQDSEFSRLRSKLAWTTRHDPDNTELHAELRARLDELRPVARIRAAVAAAPALSPEQAAEIAALLDTRAA